MARASCGYSSDATNEASVHLAQANMAYRMTGQTGSLCYMAPEVPLTYSHTRQRQLQTLTCTLQPVHARSFHSQHACRSGRWDRPPHCLCANLHACINGQVLRGTFYNEKVDVFSLGVVMWELLSYTPTIAIVSGAGAWTLLDSESSGDQDLQNISVEQPQQQLSHGNSAKALNAIRGSVLL